MCDRQCPKTGFKYSNIASWMGEDDGEPHTVNLCNGRYNERKVQRVNGKQWKRSQGRVATGLGARGLEHKFMEMCVAKKIYATNMLKDATEAVSLGTERPETSPHKEELALLRQSKDIAAAEHDARQAIEAGREHDWSVSTRSAEVNLWMMVKLKECCYCQARQDDDQRGSRCSRSCRRARAS